MGEKEILPVNTIMEVGEYYSFNDKKLSQLKESDWKIALKKCKTHVQLKTKQRTLYGAHNGSNLGSNAVDYYVTVAYDKIITGQWEWKDDYSLSEQLIRIANSCISTEVEKTKTKKSESFKIIYTDIENEIYNLADHEIDLTDEEVYAEQVKIIETATKGDDQLEMFWECIKDGYKRLDIAKLLDIAPRQLDKVREKFLRKIKGVQQTLTKKNGNNKF